MTAVPALTAVTSPSFTVATSSLSLDHVTFLSVASDGFMVTTRVSFSPSRRLRVLRLKVMASTGTLFATTTTLHVSLTLPSSVLAEITASPTDIAVIRPFSSTVATLLLLVCQLTFLLVASEGDTVAISLYVSSTRNSNSVAFNVMSVTSTSHGSFLHESAIIAIMNDNNTVKSLLRIFM